LIQLLPSAAYVALDLKVTGMNIPNFTKTNRFDRPEERYVQSKIIPERYSIVQVGISLFHENPNFKKHIKRALNSSSILQNGVNEGENVENDNIEAESDVIAGPHPVLRRDGTRYGVSSQDDGDINAMPRSNENLELSERGESSSESSVASANSRPSGDDDDDNDGNGDDDDVDVDEEPDNRGGNNVVHPILMPPIPGIPANLNMHIPILPVIDDIRRPHRNQGVIHARGDLHPHFHDNEGNLIEPPEFLVRNYKFYLAPSAKVSCREIVLNPNSIQYLKDQDIDFNTWLSHGIPFTTLEQAKSSLINFISEQKEENVEDEDLEWEEPTDAQDVAFIARSMASIREWIDSAAPHASRRLSNNLSLGDEQRLGIARVIPFPKKESLKACLKGKIKYEYPSLHWEKHHNQHVLVRLNDTEKKLRDRRKKRVAWRQMHLDNIGFTRIFKALSNACRGELEKNSDLDCEYKTFLQHEKNGTVRSFVMNNESKSDLTHPYKSSKCRRVPIVVHNGFMDFLYLLSYFNDSKLPSTYVETKELINRYFPIVYDTKVLATEFYDLPIHRNNSCLKELYKDFVIQDDIIVEGDMIIPGIPLNHTPSVRILNDRSEATMIPQEADRAYMIGTVFQCLARRLRIVSIENDVHGTGINTALRHFYKSIVSAKKSIVGSLLFLDENHPDIKTSAPIFRMNCIFLQNSIFIVDLEAVADPLRPGYSASSLFRVSRSNNSSHMDDINQIVKMMRNPESNGKVQYEVGVTPKYFIIAGKAKTFDRQEGLKNANFNNAEHRSKLLRDLLKAKFPNDSIVSLEDIIMGVVDSPWTTHDVRRNETFRSERSGLLTRIFSNFRVGSSKRSREDEPVYANRRSRT
jgi:hypothetical protein